MDTILPEVKLEQFSSCPACKSKNFIAINFPMQPRYQRFPTGNLLLKDADINIRSLVSCTCGLRYYRNIITLASLTMLYDDLSITEDWSDTTRGSNQYQKMVSAGLQFSDSEVVHILDIGCHTGLFLNSVPGIWQKSGVEINPKAVSLAKHRIPNANIRTGTFEEVEFETNSFDLITAWDVMEHIYDVQYFLEKVIKILKPDGYFVFETGNYSSTFAKIAGMAWYYYSLLEHTVFFDTKSVYRILKENDFNEIYVKLTTHRENHNKKQLFISRIKTWMMLGYSFRGRITLVHNFLSQITNKNGALSNPDYRDHMLVIARKLGH